MNAYEVEAQYDNTVKLCEPYQSAFGVSHNKHTIQIHVTLAFNNKDNVNGDIIMMKSFESSCGSSNDCQLTKWQNSQSNWAVSSLIDSYRSHPLSPFSALQQKSCYRYSSINI